MRLIDADSFKESISVLGTYWGSDVIRAINQRKTVEAQPIIHGEWVPTYSHYAVDEEYPGHVGYVVANCSVCGCKVPDLSCHVMTCPPDDATDEEIGNWQPDMDDLRKACLDKFYSKLRATQIGSRTRVSMTYRYCGNCGAKMVKEFCNDSDSEV